MKTITFCRKGQAFTDFETEGRVERFIAQDKLLDWEVGNSLVLDYFRVKIKEKSINPEDYTFLVEDLEGNIDYFNIDENGKSYDWVDSQDIWSNLITKLL